MSDSSARLNPGGARHAYRTVQAVYVSFLFGVLPLIYRNHYLDIIDVKASFYFVLSLVALLLALVCKTMNALVRVRNPGGALMGRPKPEGIAMGAFLAVNITSCLLSSNPPLSFIGEPGRLTGLGFLLLLGISYFLAPNEPRAFKWGLIALGVSGLLVSTLGIVNYLGFDPLFMYRDLDISQHGTFISTIGNRNFFGAFLCLFVPACMSAFVLCRKRSHLILSGVLCFVGFMAVLAGRSDSAFMGLLAATILLGFASLGARGRFCRFLIIIFLISLASIACGALSSIYSRMPSPAAVNVSGSLMFGNARYVLWVTGAAALFAWFFARRGISKRRMRHIRWAAASLVMMLLLSTALLFIYFSAIDRTAPLKGGWKYLRMTYEWGSHRGFIWDRSIRLFFAYPWWRMLIGCGPDMFRSEMYLYYGDGLYNVTGWILDNAHNEYLHILITSGFLGLAAYVSLIAIRLKKLFASFKSGALSALILILPIAAYAAQSVFNLWQPITTPLFIIFLAISCKNEPNAT